MKIITKEDADAHYAQVIRGGVVGGSVGVAAGVACVALLHRRHAGFRGLTLPIKAALVTSAGTFGAVVTAERYSVAFHRARDPMSGYRDSASRMLERAQADAAARGTWPQRAARWGRDNRYSVVVSSWLASLGASFYLVGRSPYLSTAQKLVQARVYAQALTLAVLVATAALETKDARAGQGRWETVMVLDPDDPEHKHMIAKKVHKEDYAGQDLWKDMVATEERRLEKQKQAREVAEAPEAPNAARTAESGSKGKAGSASKSPSEQRASS